MLEDTAVAFRVLHGLYYKVTCLPVFIKLFRIIHQPSVEVIHQCNLSSQVSSLLPNGWKLSAGPLEGGDWVQENEPQDVQFISYGNFERGEELC